MIKINEWIYFYRIVIMTISFIVVITTEFIKLVDAIIIMRLFIVGVIGSIKSYFGYVISQSLGPLSMDCSSYLLWA